MVTLTFFSLKASSPGGGGRQEVVNDPNLADGVTVLNFLLHKSSFLFASKWKSIVKTMHRNQSLFYLRVFQYMLKDLNYTTIVRIKINGLGDPGRR